MTRNPKSSDHAGCVPDSSKNISQSWLQVRRKERNLLFFPNPHTSRVSMPPSVAASTQDEMACFDKSYRNMTRSRKERSFWIQPTLVLFPVSRLYRMETGRVFWDEKRKQNKSDKRLPIPADRDSS
ncbi:hypothetical protein CDAR_593871 [Caerostris darwini]|uniref:Uncharacterized protein n=1 Tax=Caerostris darwini TaxID=1538125 RepID=A0AAV4RQI2_9ARAC|nr:hypothetical protein CDAR_593871 [Caerostris darwini]